MKNRTGMIGYVTGLMVACLFSTNSVAQDKLTLTDGSLIEYYLALPKDESASEWPLAIFMGGGSGNKPISFEAYRFVGLDLAARGWAVAVPVSPDNSSFRGNNVAKVRELIADLQSRDDIKEGKILLAGISNGGMSALEIARQNPEDYLGVMAVPALVRNNAQLDVLEGMPIYLRIGSEDQLGWAAQYDETVEKLEGFGVELNAAIIDGAPHMFGMDWDRLEPWLDDVKQ
jgi:predicted esterase